MWEWLKILWNDNVWGKVIAGLITAGILAAIAAGWAAISSQWRGSDQVVTLVIAGLSLAPISAVIWYQWRRSEQVTITNPENKKAVSTEWVKIEGTHSGGAAKSSRYNYWLMTTTGHEWWPSENLTLNVNGKWASRINVGKNPGPRISSAAVVRVTPAIHDLLGHIRKLRKRANDYSGITMPQSRRREWVVVAQLDVQIPGEIRVGETS